MFQTGLGQYFFVVGARLIPASQAALISLLEVVLGPLWVWIGYRENPGLATAIGGAVVLAAVVYQATDPAGDDGAGPAGFGAYPSTSKVVHSRPPKRSAERLGAVRQELAGVGGAVAEPGEVCGVSFERGDRPIET